MSRTIYTASLCEFFQFYLQEIHGRRYLILVKFSRPRQEKAFRFVNLAFFFVLGWQKSIWGIASFEIVYVVKFSYALLNVECFDEENIFGSAGRLPSTERTRCCHV